jgi:hypothetical protein
MGRVSSSEWRLTARGDHYPSLGVNSPGPRILAGMREVIAKRIIEMAQQGVKDRHTLVDDAVRFLAANYKVVSEQPA